MAVPSTAIIKEGIARTPDGAVYVEDLFDPAAPGAIGGTTPAAITGTTITATTGFVIPSGGAANTPTVSVAGDSDTGIYAPTAGNLNLTVDGTAAVVLNLQAAVARFGVRMFVNSAALGLGASGTQDIFMTRTSAGVMKLGSTDGGTEGSLALSKVSLSAGGASAGTVTTAATIVKAIASIADNVATDTITVTVPNAAHSASLKLTLKGSLGAGGAIGANEGTAVISYDVAIARTAGVATVAVVSTAYGSATASVAGAATIAITAAASAMTGLVSATQTFTIQVTIARGSGSSTNHTCQVVADILNANATGITIS